MSANRYNVNSFAGHKFVSDKDGEWVRYSDHSIAIKELVGELKVIRNHMSFMRFERNTTDDLIKKYGGDG